MAGFLSLFGRMQFPHEISANICKRGAMTRQCDKTPLLAVFEGP
ncbi:hypothetical protein RSSM_03716 [Rhodopirellula sallentina SM41]|uniref:Uncharacterized protein n=1 Tax=Rhodopirellula sallentina SM41 TaxID=1263870 RepID=M5U048_9BACT|nr:hypothetical protein RSSM_03716 [Rhodopirellula sallentina SM41]